MRRKIILLISIVIILTLFAFSFYNYYQYYKENYEKIIIERFIQENLRENYHPKELEVKQRLISTGETTGSDTLYGGIWYIGETKFYANLHYNLNNSKISNFQIFIVSDEIPDKPNELDETKSFLLFDKYFKIKGENEIKCEIPMTDITYCEKFWLEPNENKKGMGVAVRIFNETIIKFVGICEYPKESEDYETETCAQAR